MLKGAQAVECSGQLALVKITHTAVKFGTQVWPWSEVQQVSLSSDVVHDSLVVGLTMRDGAIIGLGLDRLGALTYGTGPAGYCTIPTTQQASAWGAYTGEHRALLANIAPLAADVDAASLPCRYSEVTAEGVAASTSGTYRVQVQASMLRTTAVVGVAGNLVSPRFDPQPGELPIAYRTLMLAADGRVQHGAADNEGGTASNSRLVVLDETGAIVGASFLRGRRPIEPRIACGTEVR